MEILNTTQNTVVGVFGVLAIVGVIISFIDAIVFLCFDDFKAALISGLIFFICLIGIFGFPSHTIDIPTNTWTYTIEITDPTKYHELIAKGYSFAKVYDSKEIYIITGDELK